MILFMPFLICPYPISWLVTRGYCWHGQFGASYPEASGCATVTQLNCAYLYQLYFVYYIL